MWKINLKNDNPYEDRTRIAAADAEHSTAEQTNLSCSLR